MNTRRPWHCVAFLLLLLLAPGCLEFDEQEVTWQYDPKSDRLHALLVYRGIYEREGNDSALEQLQRLQKGERMVALVESWPVNLQPDLKTADNVKMKAASLAYRMLAKCLLVENGSFYRDAQGRLCCWQCMRIENVTELLAAANKEIGALLRIEKERLGFAKTFAVTDAESLKLIAQACDEEQPFLTRDGSAFGLNVPASRDGHRALVAGFLKALSTLPAARGAAANATAAEADVPAKRPSDGERFATILPEIELSVVRRGMQTSFVLGNPGTARQTARVPPARRYVDNLEPLLTKAGFTVEKDITDAKIAAEFAAFCAR